MDELSGGQRNVPTSRPDDEDVTDRAPMESRGLALIAHELEKTMRRAEDVQRHARFLEHSLAGRPEQAGGADALLAENADLRIELTQLRMQHNELVQSTAWRIGRRVRRAGQRFPRTTRLARRSLKFVYWTATLRLFARLRQRQGAKRGMTLLAQSPLFDRDWYLRRYAHLLPPNVDPVAHYYWSGAWQGFDPHPLFSSAWYLSQLSNASGINPLFHYISYRGRGTPDPHPLFDTAFYLERRGTEVPQQLTPLEDFLSAVPDNKLLPNPVFDPVLYAEEYLGAFDRKPNALAHYASDGEAAGLWPHPLFDPYCYGREHPDSREIGSLAHYLRSPGRIEGVPCSEHMVRLGRPTALPMELAFPRHDAPRISIIIPIYGHVHETWRCLATIMLMTETVSYEVIVADDRPSRPVAPMLRASGITAIINDENQGFLANCNSAAKRSRGRDLLFLNNDTTVRWNWLAPMVSLVDGDPRVGVVGSKLLNPDGTVQEAGGIIYSTGWGDPFGAGDVPARGCYNYTRDVDVVTGACFIVRRDLFEKLGGFDERYKPAFYEEFDLATSIRNQGYRIVYQPASEVFHHGSASYGIETRDRQTSKNHAVFRDKWATLLAHQPAPDDPSFLSRERPHPRGMILVVDDKVPEYDKHAGAVTLFQYLGLLRELGLRVVYAPHDGEPLEPYTRALQQRGIEVLHRPDTLHGWIRKNGRFVDFIWTARPDVTAPILPWLKRHTGAKILYYTHDLHYLRERRRFELEGSTWALQESERLKPIEFAIFREVDCVMTPSRDEAREIGREVPDATVAVIPPYLYNDTAVTGAPEDLAARQDILFIGGFDHTPNVDAAVWLAQDIMPLVWQERPETTLWIVGNVPPDNVRALEGSRVRVTGFVPDLDPFLRRARVSLSPLRYGAGVKGKIVTALQAGVPVVTTPCGNEGIQLRDGQDALIGATAAELADAALTLLRDPALCDRLIRSGADVVRTRFSKELARRKLRELLGNTLCPVCGARPRQTLRCGGIDWREEIHCLACDTLNRGAGLAQVIMAPWNRYGVNVLDEARVYLASQRVHEFGHTGSIGRRLGTLPRFSCSDYFDDLDKGETSPDGIAHENVQDMSFDDDTIDLFLSQDVMEHVADPWAGFAEAHRCLKPGGRYVFTVPITLDRSVSLVRAVVENDALRHLEPPSYHGDPRRAEGALVFTEFGTDLLGRLSDIGFQALMHEIDMPEGDGQPVWVFEAIKPLPA